MLKELNKTLPREFKFTLSGVRQYSENSLSFHEERKRILGDRFTNTKDKREQMGGLRLRTEQLTVILFTYALYLKFLQGDRAIKDAVQVFSSLDIPNVQIGSMVLSYDSPYYNMGAQLAEDLVQCINDKTLLDMFSKRVLFHEISTWYKQQSQ